VEGLEDLRERVMASLRRMPTYVRVNTLKVSPEEFLSTTSLEVEPTPLRDVFKLKGAKAGKSWEYAAGLIHPQSLSSALVAHVLSPERNAYVLDLTAAPGSKATHISALMGNTGVVVANDRPDRASLILSNAARLGALNIYTTTYDAKNIPWRERFHHALLDAPCSALGSHPHAWERYSEKVSRTLSRVQRVMILRAFDALRQGGTLVYSTCTLSPEENEKVVEFLLRKRRAQLLPISTPWKEGMGMVTLYPWEVESEGFFIAKVRKL